MNQFFWTQLNFAVNLSGVNKFSFMHREPSAFGTTNISRVGVCLFEIIEIYLSSILVFVTTIWGNADFYVCWAESAEVTCVKSNIRDAQLRITFLQEWITRTLVFFASELIYYYLCQTWLLVLLTTLLLGDAIILLILSFFFSYSCSYLSESKDSAHGKYLLFGWKMFYFYAPYILYDFST